jgi:hypothetical protein
VIIIQLPRQSRWADQEIATGAGVVDLPKAALHPVDIWLFSDITNALMAIPNLIGLLLSS